MKFLYYFLLIGILYACKQANTNPKQSQRIEGEFIMIDSAAVIKGNNFIYGVVINSKTEELAKKVEPHKREEYDMVPVVIEGAIHPNTKEGWDEVVTINKIVNISSPTSELPTKIKSAADSPYAEFEHAQDHSNHEHANHQH